MFHQRLQWEGDDFLAELGAVSKKKKAPKAAKPPKPAKAKKAPKPPKPAKAKKAPKAPKAPKAKKSPKPKKVRGPIKKAKAKKAAKKAAKPKPAKKSPAAKKLKALPPAKKQALKRLVQSSKTPAPGAVFAPSPPPDEDPPPSEAEAPEPEYSEPEEMGPDEETTDMDEETPEEEDSGESENEEESEDYDDGGGDDEMGAISMALKLPRLNIKGLSKGQLATRANNAVASVCSCSGNKAKQIRGKLDEKMRGRGYPPGTPDKLLASINTLNAGLSKFNQQDLTTLRARRAQSQGGFQTEVLKRLGSTAAKLPKGHPTRKKAKRFIAKRVSGILLTSR